MVFVHFVLVSIENSVLAVDERSNYLFSRYLVPLIASLLMAPISYVFKSRASASRRAKLSELIEKGNVSQLLALSKVKNEAWWWSNVHVQRSASFHLSLDNYADKLHMLLFFLFFFCHLRTFLYTCVCVLLPWSWTQSHSFSLTVLLETNQVQVNGGIDRRISKKNEWNANFGDVLTFFETCSFTCSIRVSQ